LNNPKASPQQHTMPHNLQESRLYLPCISIDEYLRTHQQSGHSIQTDQRITCPKIKVVYDYCDGSKINKSLHAA